MRVCISTTVKSFTLTLGVALIYARRLYCAGADLSAAKATGFGINGNSDLRPTYPMVSRNADQPNWSACSKESLGKAQFDVNCKECGEVHVSYLPTAVDVGTEFEACSRAITNIHLLTLASFLPPCRGNPVGARGVFAWTFADRHKIGLRRLAVRVFSLVPQAQEMPRPSPVRYSSVLCIPACRLKPRHALEPTLD